MTEAERKAMEEVLNIDTANKYGVGLFGNAIMITLPPTIIPNKKDALNLAAWLVVLADENNEFSKVLEAVRST